MAQYELIMPKMGESIMEATILNWVKNVGEQVDVDDTIVEIATDKVDSEVPSPVSGTITKLFFEINDTVEIGKVIALIATEGAAPASKVASESNGQTVSTPQKEPKESAVKPQESQVAVSPKDSSAPKPSPKARAFTLPLVKSIAQQENIPMPELETIKGSGAKGRVTKKDILAYVQNRGNQQVVGKTSASFPAVNKPTISTSGSDEIIEMDRMRKLIADHMVLSKQTSPHVTSFIEVDVTDLVNWRNKVKGPFQEKASAKITYTPIFIEAVAKAIGDFPMINISVDGNKIIVKKNINIGMATALPSGNLIVPVIKNADQLNLVGLTKQVNGLANQARNNKLKPIDIQEGTFTITNVGTFGNVMGTPIINQPQVAILAVGAIRKKPAVVETEYGDLIAVRQLMFMSLSYDHRVVDGSLGGSFLKRIGDYLEAFDPNRTI